MKKAIDKITDLIFPVFMICVLICALLYSVVFFARLAFAEELPYIAKWYDNHTAAVSITYDDGSPQSSLSKTAQQAVLAKGLTMDTELVTGELWQSKLTHIITNMLPAGLQVFGHGHINHDALSYLEAYNSFKTCYDTMTSLGINPVASAYPGGYGFQAETWQALQDAGFLSGRLFQMTMGHNNPYILPYSDLTPANWYALNTLVMLDVVSCATDYERQMAINNTAELIPFLNGALGRTAWVILTYHGIGSTTTTLRYPMTEFLTDLDAIAERDFWCASMNDITLYARERQQANVSLEWFWNMLSIKVSDNLPNDIYDQPLTVLFDIPANWVNLPLALYQNGTLMADCQFSSINATLNLLPNELGYILRKE
jgi:hypothetical protein